MVSVRTVDSHVAAVLAKLALTADHVSGGRIDVGMGTGWNEAEHEAFGLELPPMKQRFDQLCTWLGRLSHYDLSAVDAKDCKTIDDWLVKLQAETPLDVATARVLALVGLGLVAWLCGRTVAARARLARVREAG